MPPQALASIPFANGVEDAKTAAMRFASGAVPALVDAPMSGVEWWPSGVNVADDGGSHTRLQQRINGLRVFGAEVMVHLDGAQNITGLNGEVLADFDPAALKPSLGFEAATKAARLHLGLQDRLAVESGELLIYNPAVVDAGGSANYPAYHIVLSSPARDESYTALVDARSGKLLTSFNNIESARLRSIHDLGGATTGLPGPQCHSETAPVGAASPDCIAAHRFSGETYDFFQRLFSRDSYDGAGATMRASVRYGNIGNAFWNGVQTAFGPGFATKDVVAHEWTHGMVSSTARLVYLNQSGALNESISDVMASMVDVDADWLLGEDLPRGAIRSLADPTLFNHPGKVSDQQYVCGPEDNGGVHSNSGVPNHAAYLMAMGGTYNGFTVTGIGRDNTARVYYRALTNYLTSGSSFTDAYNALRTSCADQFGGLGSATCVAVTNALQAVEMDQPACQSSGGTGTPDGYEEDDTPTSTRVAGRLLTTPENHTFHDAGDQDWVRVNVTAGASLRFETVNLQAQADTILRLYQGNGTSIIVEDDDGGGSLSSRIDYTFATGGVYYLRVVQFNPSVFGGNTGYTLQMSALTSGGDAFEPDNSTGSAKDIVAGGAPHLAHNFGTAGDVDFARFSAVGGNTYVIQTENLLPQSDTYLFLYDTDGVTPLASDDDGGGRLASRIVWLAPANGIYYIKVRGYDSSVFGPNTAYDLRVNTATTTPDQYEPDNVAAEARAINISTNYAHDFHAPSDYDWSKFAGTAGTTYTIRTQALQPRADTVMDVYDANGNLLGSNDDSAGGLASLVVVTPHVGGDVFIRVRQFDPRVFGASTGYEVRYGAPTCSGQDAFEPNGTPGTATLYPTTNGATQSHNHACQGDLDFIRFTAARNMDYDIRTSALGSGADTVLTLIDNAGNEVAFNDDGGGGLASRILWRATADGPFFVRVSHFNPTASGTTTNYQFSISSTGTAATADVHEADNTQGTAKALTIAAPHTGATRHNFHAAADHDWVVINGLTSGAPYAIESFNLGSYSDTVIEVYNGATLLVSDDDGGGGQASRALFTAPASGTVHAKVFHYTSSEFGSNTNYDLRVRPASSGTGDAYEVDDTQPAASLIAVGGVQVHDFHDAGDLDWTRFNAVGGNTYTIFTANLGPSSDTVMTLYSGATPLMSNDDGGGGLASRIIFTPTSGGTYHVRVSHFSATANGPDTSYELRLTEATAAGGDPFEPDNVVNQASALAVGNTQANHTFHVPGDVDWVSFSATAGESYVISTSALGPQSDTVIDLFAPNFTTILRTNDDDGSSLASRIEWTASATGVHVVRITHFNPNTFGPDTNYNFSVAVVAGCASGLFEPDNSPSQAIANILTPGNTRGPHDFNCAGDVDWVRLTGLSAGSRYAVDTTSLGSTSDTVLTLYNESATVPLFENDDFGGTVASRVEFIPATGWTSHAVMPFRPAEVTGVVNGQVFVVGHVNTTFPVAVFDPRANVWNTRPVNVPQGQSVGGAFGGLIYTAGGENTSGITNQVRSYNPATNAVVSLANMPTAATYSAGDFIGGQLFVVGGIVNFSGPSLTNILQRYTVSNNTWTNTLAPLPVSLHSMGAATYNNRLYVTGGELANGNKVGSLYIYDPIANSWTTGPAMPTPRSGHSLAVAGGKLYAMGGEGLFGVTGAVEVFDPVANAWTAGPSMPVATYFHRTAVINDRIYIIGGYDAGNGPQTNTWSFVPDGVTSGTDHWVRVRHYAPDVTGANTNYSLRLSLISSSAPDSHEPDNVPASSKLLTTGAPHQGATVHNIHVANDVDWQHFTVTAGQQCFFETFDLGARADTVMHLYDSSGTSELTSDDDSGGGLASRIGYLFGVSGTFKLKVHHYDPTTGGSDTNYSLRMSCVADTFEPDDNPAQASTLTVNGPSQRHLIAFDGDQDYAKFTAVGGTSYVIETHNLDFDADTTLFLFGTDGTTLLRQDEDGGDEPFAEKIVWIAPASGDYYVMVQDYAHPYYSGPNTGYDLRVRTGTADTRLAQVAVVAGDGSGRVQLRVRPLQAADAMKVQVFAKAEQLSFAGAESLIPGKGGETAVVRLLDSPAHEPAAFGAYLEGKQLAETLAGNEAMALNFMLVGTPSPRGKVSATVRVTLISESGEVSVVDMPTVISAADAQPRVNAINPQAIPTESGGTFTVYGSNFVITPKVFLINNGSPLELRDVRIGLDGSWLEATVPAGTKIGGFKVRVQNPNGSYADSADDLYVTRGGTQCDFTLSQDRVIVSGAGGPVAVNVTTGQACVWVPQPGVSWVRVNTPTEASGSAQASFTVNASPDGSAREGVVTIGSRTLIVSQAANSNPTISSIGNQTINQDTSTGNLGFTVGDADGDAVTVQASSNNPTLVPTGNIGLGGSGANRTVNVTPAAGQSGTAQITLTATDGRGGSASTSFSVTVVRSDDVGIPRDIRADVSDSTIVDVQWAAPLVGQQPTSYRVEAGRSCGAMEVSGTTTQLRLTVNLTGRPLGRWFVWVIGLRDSRESQRSECAIADIGAPLAPRNLQFSVLNNVVTITWLAPASADATGYVIHAGTGPGLSNIVQLPHGATSFVSPGPVPNGIYYVRIHATNQFGISPASNEVRIAVGIVEEPPTPPSNLASSVTGNNVSLSWQAGVGGGAPTHFEIHAGSAPGLSDIVVAPVGNVLSFGAANVPNGRYFVRVRAVNAFGPSGFSNEVIVQVGAVIVPPGAPTGFTATVTGNSVTVSWAAPTTGGAPTTYVIDVGSTSGASNIVQAAVGNVTTFTAGGVPPGVYFARVRAVNSGGSGPASNEVRIQVP